MLDPQLSVNSKELVYFIFKLEPEGDFFIESLFRFLIVLVQNLFLIVEVDVFSFQAFDLSEDRNVSVFIELIIFLDDFLPFGDFLSQLLDLYDLFSFNYSHHRLEFAFCTVFKQNGENFPNVLLGFYMTFHNLSQIVIKPNAMNKKTAINSLHIFWLNSSGQQRIFIDLEFLQCRIGYRIINNFNLSCLSQDGVEPSFNNFLS